MDWCAPVLKCVQNRRGVGILVQVGSGGTACENEGAQHSTATTANALAHLFTSMLWRVRTAVDSRVGGKRGEGMNAKKETVIGCGLMGGLGLLVLGYVVGFMLVGGGLLRLGFTRGEDGNTILLSVVGPVIMIVGLVVIAASIFHGFMSMRKTNQQEAVNHPDVLVVARFAINEVGEMVFQDFDPDDPDTKLFVHLKFPGGRNGEFRCPLPVFDCCGEGMRGSAIVKGDWLGGFSAFPVQPGTPLR
jgi:hypothetical protein